MFSSCCFRNAPRALTRAVSVAVAVLAAQSALALDGGITPVSALVTLGGPDAGSLVVSMPSGVLDGDALLMGVYLDEGGDVPTVAGWTRLESQVNQGAAPASARWAVFFKLATQEPTNFTVGWASRTGASGCAAVVGAFRGVEPSAPLSDFVGGRGWPGPARAVAVPPGGEHVVLALADLSAGLGNWSPPTGATVVSATTQAAMFDLRDSTGDWPGDFTNATVGFGNFYMTESIALAPLGWDGGSALSIPRMDPVPVDVDGGFSFRSVTTASVTQGVTRVRVSRGPGLTQGDLVLASIYHDFSTSTVAPPNGWALLGTELRPTPNDFAVSWLAHRVGALEPAQWTFELNDNNYSGVTAVTAAWGGVASVGPFASANGGSGTSVACPAIVLPTPSRVVVLPAADTTFGSGFTFSTPAGFTARLSADRVGVFELTAPAVGPVGTYSVAGSNQPGWAASTVALVAGVFSVLPDAGPTDAGVDGGALDAGAPDGGSPDAGVLDAGSADAGPSDGGGLDASAGPGNLVVGCGCQPPGAGGPGLLVALLAAASARRRRPQSTGRV